MFPKVVQVIPMKNYSVYVYFDDGKIVCYDMSRMIDKGVFCALRDIDVFMDTCTVLNDTLAWDIKGNRDHTACLDIDPDTLYELPYVKEQIA
ncbi:MAG: DUF2442 domain-containing protein [Roseburia sp.]|nr:DUF2442 domain-containing protein [Roseburia sp.]